MAGAMIRAMTGSARRVLAPSNAGRLENTYALWLFGTSGFCPRGAFGVQDQGRTAHGGLSIRGCSVKKIALAMVLVVAGLSLGGCFVGKGKAPAPVVTKG